MAGLLDFHNHLIPGVDDGSPSIETSMIAIAEMANQNITHIITTPHLQASALARPDHAAEYRQKVDAHWERLLIAAKSRFPSVALHRGHEILLDSPSLDLGDPKLRLAGTSFCLVEFPFLSIPPRSADILFAIKVRGFEPVVAHPERYRDVQQGSVTPEDWRRVGAHLQSNAGSFIGFYGPEAKKASHSLIQKGLVDYVCSDYHANGSCLSRQAFELISTRYGRQIADLLFSVNPQRLLANEKPMPMPKPSSGRRSLFDRVAFWRRPSRWPQRAKCKFCLHARTRD